MTSAAEDQELLEQPHRLHLSQWMRRGLWLLIFVFQTVNAVFLIALACLYLDLKSHSSLISHLMYAFLFSASQQFLMDHYVYIGIGYALVSLPFLIAIVQMLWHSMRHKRLVFQAPARHARSYRVYELDRARPARSMGLIQLVDSVMSMRGLYFPLYLLTLETFEIVLQTSQAYGSSKFISRWAINQCYGAMIFVNCWSGPLCHFYWKRKNPMLERLFSVLIDVILDFFWGTLVQAWLLIPYCLSFWDAELFDEFAAVPENSERELQQFFVLSMWNFVLSVFPFVTSAAILSELRTLLNDSEVTTGHAIHPTEDHDDVKKPNTTINGPEPPFGLVRRSYMIILMGYGLCILGISIGSSGYFVSSDSIVPNSCTKQVFPWFTQQEICVDRTVNCTDLAMAGRADELEPILTRIDGYLLANLAFVDCLALELTPLILKYDGIRTLQLRNVIVQHWDVNASLTDHTFPALQTLRFRDTVVNCTPSGLLTYPLPQSFEWISFYRVNAGAFLEQAKDASIWRHVDYFYCEVCELTEFPKLVVGMDDVREVYLTKNQITALPVDGIGTKPVMYALILYGNPIETLPDPVWQLAVGNDAALMDLNLENTNVSVIPSFLDDETAMPILMIKAYGTAICHNSSQYISYKSVVCEEPSPFFLYA